MSEISARAPLATTDALLRLLCPDGYRWQLSQANGGPVGVRLVKVDACRECGQLRPGGRIRQFTLDLTATPAEIGDLIESERDALG